MNEEILVILDAMRGKAIADAQIAIEQLCTNWKEPKI